MHRCLQPVQLHSEIIATRMYGKWREKNEMNTHVLAYANSICDNLVAQVKSAHELLVLQSAKINTPN